MGLTTTYSTVVLTSLVLQTNLIISTDSKHFETRVTRVLLILLFLCLSLKKQKMR